MTILRYPRHAAVCFSILVLLLFSLTSVALASQHWREALKDIQEFADNICTRLSQRGETSKTKIEGEARAELPGVVKKLVDLGISTAAVYQNEEYLNVLQADLAPAIKHSDDCRKGLADKLIDKIIPSPSQDVITTDKIAGKWSGEAKDSNGVSFQVEVEIGKSCTFNQKCGSISVSHVPCHGKLSLYQINGSDYEFSVDSFTSDSHPVCKPGAGEHFRLLDDSTLLYTATYAPKAGGILKRSGT